MPSDAASSRAKPFDASSWASAAVGSEARHAGGGAPIGDAGHQRRLRPGDHEVEGVEVDGRARSAATVTSCPWRRQAQAIAASRPPATDDRDPHHASTPSKLSLAWASATSSG